MNHSDKLTLTQFAHVYLFCWSKGLYNAIFEKEIPGFREIINNEINLERSELIDGYFAEVALPQIKKILTTDLLLIDYFYNYCNVLIKTKPEGRKTLQAIHKYREEYVWNNLSKLYTKEQKDEFYTGLLANLFRFELMEGKNQLTLTQAVNYLNFY